MWTRRCFTCIPPGPRAGWFEVPLFVERDVNYVASRIVPERVWRRVTAAQDRTGLNLTGRPADRVTVPKVFFFRPTYTNGVVSSRETLVWNVVRRFWGEMLITTGGQDRLGRSLASSQYGVWTTDGGLGTEGGLRSKGEQLRPTRHRFKRFTRRPLTLLCYRSLLAVVKWFIYTGHEGLGQKIHLCADSSCVQNITLY